MDFVILDPLSKSRFDVTLKSNVPERIEATVRVPMIHFIVSLTGSSSVSVSTY